MPSSFAEFTAKSVADVTRVLGTTSNGLDPQERKKRLLTYGKNAFGKKTVSWRHVLVRQFKNPFIFILFFAAAISLALGDTTEGLLMVLFVMINTLLGFSQEFQSSKAIELLKKYIQPSCQIKEAGQEKTVTCEELVPGDVMIVRTGDLVAADARITRSSHLLVDESILTGESMAREKTDKTKKASSIQNAENIVFAGTKVLEGLAETVILHTGTKTEMGLIASTSSGESGRLSPFERGLQQFSQVILKLVGVTLVLVFLANLIIKGSHANLLEYVLFSIALAVSVIPEALPFVITISLSRGALHLAKKSVVVKHLSSIEDLGSIQVLCTDKTGTITENKMQIIDIMSDQKEDCLLYAHLGRGSLSTQGRQSNNSFDLAIEEYIKLKKIHIPHTAYHILQELPFDPTRRRNSTLVESSAGKELIVRGAPEALIKDCFDVHHQQKQEILDWCKQQGRQGRRTLAIGCKRLSIHAKESLSSEECHVQFLGIIAFEDPLKPTAKHAIVAAKAAGIQIKILTGDSKEVAESIARQIGLVDQANQVVTGDEWDALSETEKQKSAKAARVFARVAPEQKYQIIQELQHTYEVGFLGEGINDAPALKMADVGLVVKGASDIARDAASVILLNQSLNVIIDGIQEGRRVFANTVKYIKTTLTANFGNFYAIAVASLLINHLPMLPIEILLVNLLTDFPMLAVSTDSVDPEELQTPKHYDVRDIIVFATILGLLSNVFDFLFFAIFFHQPAATMQTNWFIMSVLTELVLVFSVRTLRPFWKANPASKPLIGLSIVAGIIALVLPYVPFTRQLFSFTHITPRQLVITLSITLAYFIATEMVKLQLSKRQRTAN